MFMRLRQWGAYPRGDNLIFCKTFTKSRTVKQKKEPSLANNKARKNRTEEMREKQNRIQPTKFEYKIRERAMP